MANVHIHVWQFFPKEASPIHNRVDPACYCWAGAIRDPYYVNWATQRLNETFASWTWNEKEKTLTSHYPTCRCRVCVKFAATQRWGVTPEASDRATRFFRSHLNPWQKYTMTVRGYVDVTDAACVQWRLDTLRLSGNVYRWKCRRWYQGCSVIGSGYGRRFPSSDQYLAQLLMIKTNPAKFNNIVIFSGCATDARNHPILYWEFDDGEGRRK